MYLQEPKAPPGVCFSLDISLSDSKLVSIISSLRAPKIPFFAAKILPILLDLRPASKTPAAVAFITEVTPPDCAYRTFLFFMDAMLLKS